MSAGTLTTVATDLIDAGPNDRQTFSIEELRELADSIAEHGLAQPPTLRRIGERFEIVAGERRTRAMRDILGWAEVPAIVRELSDEAASAIMLAENIQRVDLDPLEEARAYQNRIDRFGSALADIAKLASVPVERVRRRLALLKLSDDVARMVSRRQLPLSYAAAMVELDSNRQLLALKGYQSGRMDLESFRGLCQRLLAEQQSETMFDPDTFLQVEEYVSEALADCQPGVYDGEVDDPVGPAEIAERLNVKPKTVHVWKVRGILPAPEWTVSGVPIWQWRTIRAWAIETKRLDTTAGAH